MAEDLGKRAECYALYLPAIQDGSAAEIVSDEPMRTSGSSPTPLRMSALNWLEPSNPHWHYRWCLASAGHFMGTSRDNAVNTAHPNTVIFGDSAGYQIGTGKLSEIKPWLAFRDRPDEIIAAWSSCDLPIRIMRWLEAHCDYGMTIDMPLWAKMPTREATPFHYLTEQQLLTLTVSNLELMSKRRDRQSRCKFLNVLQAYTPTGSDDDYLASEERWFEAVKDYDFEGWALGGEVGAKGGLRRVLRRLLILRDQGLLAPPRNWCHVLGVSTTEWAVCLTAIQRAIRASTNPDFTISFDSASPYVTGGRYNTYAIPPDFGTDRDGWLIRSAKLPTGFAVANAKAPQPFPASSPIASMFTLQDLNPRQGDFERKTMDMLGDQVLINHNVYVYVKAMIEANEAVFVRGVAPRSIMDAISMIEDVCGARGWPTVLARYGGGLDAVVPTEADNADEDEIQES
jgi:hypothetical protein